MRDQGRGGESPLDAACAAAAGKVPREVIEASFGIILEGDWLKGPLRARVEALAAQYGTTFDLLIPWVRHVISERNRTIDIDDYL
ncbi:hypothetical protein [Methylobacterium sp. JK268]